MGNRILIIVLGYFLASTLFSSMANAGPITEVPFEFMAVGSPSDLDWDRSCDDCSSGSTPLGFTVTVGGQSYSHFDMDSNGYVELLTGISDSLTGYGYGSLSELIGSDDTSTYLLAAYDDLSSSDYGFFGYQLNAGNAVFYWLTETYDDEDSEYLNEFEIILSDNGDVRWNFNFADFSNFGNDLFTGLYFGNSGTTLLAIDNTIPVETSYLHTRHISADVPEPAPLALLGLGLLGLGLARKRRG